jgi:TIR domain
LYLSHGDIPEVFVRGTGVPDSFIEHMHLLIASPMEYHTVFISSSGLDQAFAERLYADLQDKSVQCWMAPHDLRPGDYHHSRIDEAIHRHEKVLLLLSEHAVNSSWVKHEVQIALAREINQDRTILFPLRLDQAVMQTKVDWAVRLRESRHIGDFTAWQDDAAYQQAFSILLRDLKVDRLPTL